MSDKIPDEIKRKAEDWAMKYANDIHGAECVTSDFTTPEWQATYDDALISYAMCYRDLITNNAPTAWVCGHETKGYNGMSLNFSDANTARMIHVDEEYGGESYNCEDLDEAWKRAEEDGWFVVPVKLLKLEGK